MTAAFSLCLMTLLAGTGCDSKVCAGPDCGPDEPPSAGEPQGPEWDIDGDSISNNTELHPPNAIYGFRVDTADGNPSRVGGIPESGWIDSAINLPDTGTMHWHYLGSDAAQTDDWGIRTLLNVIEGAGRAFQNPRGFPGTCRYYTEWAALPRIQVGDLSLQYGGAFGQCGTPTGHCSHQNGTDVDVRYLRTDGFEIGLNLATADSVKYDILQTLDLFSCFMRDPRVIRIYYDSARTGILNVPERPGLLVDAAGHSNHFHVRVRPY
jgi:hypothetical protein